MAKEIDDDDGTPQFNAALEARGPDHGAGPAFPSVASANETCEWMRMGLSVQRDQGQSTNRPLVSKQSLGQNMGGVVKEEEEVGRDEGRNSEDGSYILGGAGGR
ncbi:hypothetical protein N7449_000186 [Penicillium cf. viridicatum]|uniref:Uncharacterized protein n=1 Tax=Penicillium cf. viridicatum TaxID=2972119 RepID=A0A9W9T827_9EURO|nr:hypothetical protein N7449_000186 [Penicillium cf. viridicatum]